MPTRLNEVENYLNSSRLRDNLTPLFLNTLNWGKPQSKPYSVTATTPISRSLTVVPVAELAGLPVLRVDWDSPKLPNITERRAVQKAIAPKAIEHLLCYVTRDNKQAAFVWSRPTAAKGKKTSKIELRTLPYEVGSPARTTIERLGEMGFSFEELGLYGQPAVTAVTDKMNIAFDVEAVKDQFFRQYSQIFHEVEDSVKGVPKGEARRLFTQQLFNRLMFIAFIQKKGWLHIDGQKDKNYLEALWQTYQNVEDEQSNFYKGRLNALFFNGLNNPRGHDVTEALSGYIGKVPYLNGGLFEATKDDLNTAVDVPDECFDSVLHRLFNCFNFTVTESTPFDIEVAVDPEMLGKVFEELVTDRHEKGSYYTPRPIVAFMCQEALKGYLGGYETLVDDHDPKGIDVPTARALLKRLFEIKVVDPACGSGAYLLGMLHELHTLVSLLETRAEPVTPRDDYDRKLKIIQNNLYGVDEDAFAVNIARLRLWLSLAVEYEGKKPEPLPNLDFKIEVGDSLTAPAPSGGLQADMFRQNHIEEFEAKKAEYANPYFKGNKAVLKQEIEDLRNEIKGHIRLKQKVSGFDWQVEFAEVFEQREPLATIGGAFNFGQELAEQPEPGGFDIVMANPPYVRQELIKELKPTLQQVFPEVYSGTADLYCYFYARAVQLLRPGGMLVFISSNKWFRAGYGANLRKHIADTCGVRSITDFGDLPVFKSATAYPMIFVARKEATKGSVGLCLTEVKSLDAPYPDVRAIIAQQGQTLPSSALNGADWTLTDATVADRLKKMKKAGIPLGDYVKGKVYRGLLTGFNNAFVIDSTTRRELIAKDPHSIEIIKPLVMGRDVRKWIPSYKDKWIIVTKIGVDIKRYPAIFKHLKQWQKELEARQDQGEHWWELRSCAYYHEFDKRKILYPDIAVSLRFGLDTEGTYMGNTAYFMPTDDLYLLGVLNSSLVEDFYIELSSQIRGGYVRFFTQYVKQIPIPEASTTEQSAIEKLVKKCVDAKGVGCEAWEKEIDERVAALYGL